LNWKSLTARKYKIGLINCLLNRIWRICTTQEHRNEEVKRLKIISLKNEYPENIINQTINKYISRITLPNQPKPQKETKRFIVLPFVNKKAEDFAVRLKSLVEESYSQVDFNVAFKSPKDHRQLVSIQRSNKRKNKSIIGSLQNQLQNM